MTAFADSIDANRQWEFVEKAGVADAREINQSLNRFLLVESPGATCRPEPGNALLPYYRDCLKLSAASDHPGRAYSIALCACSPP